MKWYVLTALKVDVMDQRKATQVIAQYQALANYLLYQSQFPPRSIITFCEEGSMQTALLLGLPLKLSLDQTEFKNLGQPSVQELMPRDPQKRELPWLTVISPTTLETIIQEGDFAEQKPNHSPYPGQLYLFQTNGNLLTPKMTWINYFYRVQNE